jgi:hypothetical protein
MGKITIKGEIVKEWLKKWPDLPSNQLARMIYASDNNHLLFSDKEAVRKLIRLYRGANGKTKRESIHTKEFFRPFKTIIHDKQV